MKIGKMQVYPLICGTAIAAACGYGLKKYADYRLDVKGQAIEARQYIEKTAPDRYEDIAINIYTNEQTNNYLVDRMWINYANQIKDSLELSKK